MLRQGNWGLKCEASQDRALKLYPAVITSWIEEGGVRGFLFVPVCLYVWYI